MRTIQISEESYARIVEELSEAKNAIEHNAREGDADAYYNSADELTEITTALKELGA